jgi:RHS repeat-associated protein
MPRDMTVDHISLGDLGDGSNCSIGQHAQAQLYVRESPDGDMGNTQQIAYSLDTPTLTATPSKVTFHFDPLTFHAGHGYLFLVVSQGPCMNIAETTWAHNRDTVDPGPANCAGGPDNTGGGPTWRRLWHQQGVDDHVVGCADQNNGSDFSPDMPTGWLFAWAPSGNWWILHGTPNPLDPPTTVCIGYSDYNQLGAVPVGWQPGTVSNAYVCAWKEWAPMGTTVPDGWYFGLPWPRERTGAVRDTYLELGGPEFPAPSDLFGPGNPSAPFLKQFCAGDPVNCTTGNFTESYTDFRVGGLGLGLTQKRTYNAQDAVSATSPGAFGYGWSGSFRERLEISGGGSDVVVHHSNGSTARFTANADGSYSGQAWVQATLTKNADGSYTYVLPDQRTFDFESSGRLVDESDRNGNKTTLTYTSGNLTKVTDPAGRAVTFSNNPDGTVATATDPAGHQVSYTYTGGDLTSVKDVGLGTTQYGYDGNHRLTTITDPRSNKVLTNVYDSSNRVTSQTDGLSRTTTWSYVPGKVTITDPAGNVTEEQFAKNVPTQVTKAKGTAAEATTTYEYDSKLELIKRTDPNTHLWQYGYGPEGNRTSVTDPRNHTTQYTYDAKRDVTSVTKPLGQQTTFGYDSNGNLTSVQRTLTETGAQLTTTLGYDALGELTSVTDPLNRKWAYGYNSHGDRTSATSPLGHKTTSAHDADSFVTSTVSARGNDAGANPASFTTTIARNAFESPTTVTDGSGKQTVYAYDANQNLTDVTDREGRHRSTTYDAMNQPTQVTRGDGSIWKTSYDPLGQVASQTDGLGRVTAYAYDAQERLNKVTDPLNRAQTFGYDAGGNRTTIVDQQGRTTTLGYDSADELTSMSFSSGNPSAVSFAYDSDGQRTSMTDATGTTGYAHDSLGRVTSQTSGAGQKTTYGYDSADEVTSIAYPPALTALAVGGSGGQTQVQEGTVTRAFDGDGNLASVTDWLNHKTNFGYDSDANLTAVTRPNGVNAIYTYDNNGGLGSVKDTGTTTTLGRTPEELLKSSAVGTTTTNYSYDGSERMTAAGTLAYKYDAGDNLTQTNTPTGTAVTQSFDVANELTSTKQGTTTTNTYTYDAMGERLMGTPSSGAKTTLTWNQAGQLAAYNGPDKTASKNTTTVSQQYAYNGDGLRQTKTSNNSLTNHVYDLSSGLPLMIEDGPTAYITGPGGLPIEQVVQGGTIRYFSRDQLGSTTALTSSTGTTAQSYKYDGYGQLTGTNPTVANPFRYAAQYTDPETGLQYLRARYYEPATGQMLGRDPMTSTTRQPYAYTGGDPLNQTDPSGMISVGGAAAGAGGACAGTFEIPIIGEIDCGGAAILGVAAAAGAVASWATANDDANQSDDTAAQPSTADQTDDSCSPGAKPTDTPNFADPTQPPGPGWEWRGSGPPSSGKGSWYNPATDESLHPDLSHPEGIDPHYDWRYPGGPPKGSRVFEDGRVEPK